MLDYAANQVQVSGSDLVFRRFYLGLNIYVYVAGHRVSSGLG